MPSLPAKEGKNIGAPHIVLLGAGASIAAYNDWGKIGSALPSMLNTVELLDLKNLIESAALKATENFENLYDQIASDAKHANLRKELEKFLKPVLARGAASRRKKRVEATE